MIPSSFELIKLAQKKTYTQSHIPTVSTYANVGVTTTTTTVLGEYVGTNYSTHRVHTGYTQGGRIVTFEEDYFVGHTDQGEQISAYSPKSLEAHLTIAMLMGRLTPPLKYIIPFEVDVGKTLIVSDDSGPEQKEDTRKKFNGYTVFLDLNGNCKHVLTLNHGSLYRWHEEQVFKENQSSSGVPRFMAYRQSNMGHSAMVTMFFNSTDKVQSLSYFVYLQNMVDILKKFGYDNVVSVIKPEVLKRTLKSASCYVDPDNVEHLLESERPNSFFGRRRFNWKLMIFSALALWYSTTQLVYSSLFISWFGYGARSSNLPWILATALAIKLGVSKFKPTKEAVAERIKSIQEELLPKYTQAYMQAFKLNEGSPSMYLHELELFCLDKDLAQDKNGEPLLLDINARIPLLKRTWTQDSLKKFLAENTVLTSSQSEEMATELIKRGREQLTAFNANVAQLEQHFAQTSSSGPNSSK